MVNRGLLDSRNSGLVSAEAPGVHHHSDDGVPDGSQGSGAAVKKVGNFHILAATVSRDVAQRKLIDDLLALFGGRSKPVMAHLIESGKLTLDDVKEAEKTLRTLSTKGETVMTFSTPWI